MPLEDSAGGAALAKAFAAQLRAERAAAGLTQTELARLAGVDRKTIHRIETNQRDMNTPQLAALCHALGLSPTVFVGRAEARLRGELA